MQLFYTGSGCYWVHYCAGGFPCEIVWTIIGGTNELDIRGARLTPHWYPIAIDMLATGRLPMNRIISHRLTPPDFQLGIDPVAGGGASIKLTLAP